MIRAMIIRQVKEIGLRPGEKALLASWDRDGRRIESRIDILSAQVFAKDHAGSEFEEPTRTIQGVEYEFDIVFTRSDSEYLKLTAAEELALEAELKEWIIENIEPEE